MSTNEGRFTCDTSRFLQEIFKGVGQHPCDTQKLAWQQNASEGRYTCWCDTSCVALGPSSPKQQIVHWLPYSWLFLVPLSAFFPYSFPKSSAQGSADLSLRAHLLHKGPQPQKFGVTVKVTPNVTKAARHFPSHFWVTFRVWPQVTFRITLIFRGFVASNLEKVHLNKFSENISAGFLVHVTGMQAETRQKCVPTFRENSYKRSVSLVLSGVRICNSGAWHSKAKHKALEVSTARICGSLASTPATLSKPKALASGWKRRKGKQLVLPLCSWRVLGDFLSGARIIFDFRCRIWVFYCYIVFVWVAAWHCPPRTPLVEKIVPLSGLKFSELMWVTLSRHVVLLPHSVEMKKLGQGSWRRGEGKRERQEGFQGTLPLTTLAWL